MHNALIRKLERFAPLTMTDKHFLDDIIKPSRAMHHHADLAREGLASEHVRLILTGLACRYKSLTNGKRQIVAYLIPGDLCDLNVFLLNAMDHSISTISACNVVDIPRQSILEMTSRPNIALALWRVTLVDEGTLREWLLNVGQRPATQRLAHLFCELYVRLQAAGLARNGKFELPLIQTDLADATGLSPVHINRCLQILREMDLVTFRTKQVTISSVEGLMRFCHFNPNYLHLDGERHTS